MNADRQQAMDYLRAPADGLWHWAENGGVLVWHDGTTVAFRQEIIQILEWLAPHGLPDFGAIVYLLAACRGKVPLASEIVPDASVSAPLSAKLDKQAEILLTAKTQLRVQLVAALAELQKVTRLPAAVNTGIKARCVLAEAVFEAAKNERRTTAATVLSGLREPMTDADLRQGDLPYTGNPIRQIHIVAEGLKPHTAQSLALRMAAGLDALPPPIDTDLPPTDQARQLIAELSRDTELGPIARAARELMAALRLPRRLAETEQLSIGGVADITNRGPLDRLLLSELAHDDLTLSVRVALNEALYLRREPPLREPPGALLLLLDSGVRLWGVPRVLATAVALALIARDKQHSQITASRAHQNGLAAVDLLSRAGLTQHLSALETEAHPGPALPAFAAQTAADAQTQSVLITHRDTLADPEFRHAIAAQPGAIGFIAAVDREGHFELHALPLSRRPPLCAADLDLASIFSEKSGAPPVKKVEVDPSLPAIFGVQPFPLLLPVAGSPEYWIKSDDGLISAALSDKTLVQFRAPFGGRLLANNLPSGKTLWMGCAEETLHLVKAGASQRPTRLVSQPLPHGNLRVTDLVSGEEVLAVHCYGDAIVLIRKTDVRAHSLGDGRLLERILNPHRWIHGRYFSEPDRFYFVVWDGTKLKFEPVTLPRSLTPSVVCLVFDRAGFEGPWLVHRDGSILPTDGGPGMKLPMPPQCRFGLDDAKASRDGSRIYGSIQSLPAVWSQILDLDTGYAHGVLPAMSEWFISSNQSPPYWPKRNIFHKFSTIARLHDGIALRYKKLWRKLSLNGHGELVNGVPEPSDLSGDLVQISFNSPKPLPQHYHLRLAKWPGGSKAFLDKRGLLHLKSHDLKIPEISLVLTDGEVAGWTSDGHVCGPPFFFEGTHASEPRAVFDRIMAFLTRL